MGKFLGQVRDSRKKAKRTKRVDAESSSVEELLRTMHLQGCPRVLLQLVYYVLVASPIQPHELVDTLEVFAGQKQLTEV